jgi:hypothetical protein
MPLDDSGDSCISFAFNGVANLLFEVRFRVIVLVAGNQDRSGEFIMLKFPMRTLASGNLKPPSSFEVFDKFSDFAGHHSNRFRGEFDFQVQGVSQF